MTQHGGDHHDWQSAAYVAEWVARSRSEDAARQPALRLVADLVPRPREAALAILDIGAGHGALTRVMLETFPNASVVAQDCSDQMLRHARTELAPFAPRVRSHPSDLLSPTWAEGIGGPFDAAVSSPASTTWRTLPASARCTGKSTASWARDAAS